MLYLMAWRVWTPVSTGELSQVALNFMGMVLFDLNERSGLAKLPPVASAPPMGERKPVNWKVEADVSTVTVNEQRALFPPASVAVQFTVVVPTGNTEPESGLQTRVVGQVGRQRRGKPLPAVSAQALLFDHRLSHPDDLHHGPIQSDLVPKVVEPADPFEHPGT